MSHIVLGTPQITLNLDTQEWLFILVFLILAFTVRFFYMKYKRRMEDSESEESTVETSELNQD